MEAVAKLRNTRISPRKMRMVADLVRGKKVSYALNVLKFEPKAGAIYVEKLILSAISNWEQKNPELGGNIADLHVTKVWVDAGKTLKRIQPAPQGRAHRISKRSNHVTLMVDLLEYPEDADALEEVAADIASDALSEDNQEDTNSENQE